MTNADTTTPAPIAEGDPVVFVIDDDPSVREGLENLLRSVGLEVQSFGSAPEFLRSKRPDAPACLVLDVRLPGPSGLNFQRELTEMNIPIPIIFVTGHGDIPMTVKAMKAGAVEFLTKPFREEELLDAVQQGIYRDRLRWQNARATAALQQQYNSLTTRERDVMAHIVAGRLNKQIAADLEVSEVTVKFHRRQVMRKMLAKSVADLVRMADKLGIEVRRV